MIKITNLPLSEERNQIGFLIRLESLRTYKYWHIRTSFQNYHNRYKWGFWRVVFSPHFLSQKLRLSFLQRSRAYASEIVICHCNFCSRVSRPLSPERFRPSAGLLLVGLLVLDEPPEADSDHRWRWSSRLRWKVRNTASQSRPCVRHRLRSRSVSWRPHRDVLVLVLRWHCRRVTTCLLFPFPDHLGGQASKRFISGICAGTDAAGAWTQSATLVQLNPDGRKLVDDLLNFRFQAAVFTRRPHQSVRSLMQNLLVKLRLRLFRLLKNGPLLLVRIRIRCHCRIRRSHNIGDAETQIIVVLWKRQCILGLVARVEPHIDVLIDLWDVIEGWHGPDGVREPKPWDLGGDHLWSSKAWIRCPERRPCHVVVRRAQRRRRRPLTRCLRNFWQRPTSHGVSFLCPGRTLNGSLLLTIKIH